MPRTFPTQTATPQDLTFPDEAFRAQQPKPDAPHPFRLPAVHNFTIGDGISVYLVEQHTLPIVSMDLNFDGGSNEDPAGKDGLAGVCASLLTEGTQKLDKIAYSEALADVASSISAYAADDSQGVSLASLTKHLDVTLALFADTLRAPGLRPSDFDRLLKRRIEAVKQSRANPTQIPNRVMGAVLYGAEHPLGRVITEASLAAITLDDCKQQLASWVQPHKARLFVVGDLTEAQLRAAFDKVGLAAWKGVAKAPHALPMPKQMTGRIFFVNVAKAPQSTVMLLAHGPARTAPDYFANTLTSAVFGGGFTSRLNMNLREDKGYSYAARGGFSYNKDFGALTVSAPVQADATYQTMLEIAREQHELASGKAPVTAAELDREKTNAELALPGRFATAQAAIGQYRSLVYFGLPLDYFRTYTDKVRAVTAEQVKQAATAHLKADDAVFLVVGDGDAPMIVDGGKPGDPPATRKQPMLDGGKPVTLRQALNQLASRGDVGAGGLVELDVDARPVR